MRGRLLLAMTFLFAACGDSGPVYPIQSELYDWVKSPEAIHPESDQSPVISDPAITFRLKRGERQSALRAGEDWRTGQIRLFGFDVRVVGNVLPSEVVDISQLYRVGSPSTKIISVQLDAKRGVTVFGRTCIAAKDLGAWHRVEMRIRLRNDDFGYLEVFCDRKPVWARTNIRTTFPPVCRIREGCNLAVPEPQRYEWQVGVMANRGLSKPFTLQMQRLHHRLLIYTPNRAGNL